MFSAAAGWLRLLHAHDHRVWSGEMLDVSLSEPNLRIQEEPAPAAVESAVKLRPGFTAGRKGMPVP